MPNLMAVSHYKGKFLLNIHLSQMLFKGAKCWGAAGWAAAWDSALHTGGPSSLPSYLHRPLIQLSANVPAKQ